MKKLISPRPFNHLSTPPRGADPRTGMTMVELVAALAIFMMLFGILLIALNSATNLWGKSRVQNQEQPLTRQLVEIITEDLYQAVTDLVFEHGDNATVNPTADKSFWLENIDPDNIPITTPTILLAFPRIAGRHTRDPDDDPTTRLELDAIFYTYYQRALFRQAIPIHTRYDPKETIGELLASYAPVAVLTATHDNLLDPKGAPPMTSAALLAWNVIPTFAAHYHPDLHYGDQNEPPLQTNALPAMIDVALHIFEESDWNQYQNLRHDSSQEAAARLEHLGTLATQRITLPQAGGVHLP